jgi:hypothetical protein
MVGIASGRVVAFLVFLIAVIGSYITIKMAQMGRLKVDIKRIAGLEAIDEAIGRAVEMGRPIHFTSGSQGLSRATGAQTIAGMSILSYMATKTAQLDTRLVATAGNSQTIPVLLDVIESAYVKEGKQELFDPNMVQFFADGIRPYIFATIGWLERNKVGANIMVGGFTSEALMFSEVSQTVGAIQIGGTARIVTIPYMVVACDYTLICDEIYAVSAYLTKDPLQLSSIYSADLLKVASLLLIILGVITNTLGIDFISILAT